MGVGISVRREGVACLRMEPHLTQRKAMSSCPWLCATQASLLCWLYKALPTPLPVPLLSFPRAPVTSRKLGVFITPLCSLCYLLTAVAPAPRTVLTNLRYGRRQANPCAEIVTAPKQEVSPSGSWGIG